MRFDSEATFVYEGKRNALDEWTTPPKEVPVLCGIIFMDEKTQISSVGEDSSFDVRLRVSHPMKQPYEVIYNGRAYRVRRNPHHRHSTTFYLQEKVNSGD